MGIVIKEEVKFELLPQHIQQAVLDVIVYRLTCGGDVREEAQNTVEETKKTFLKLYE